MESFPHLTWTFLSHKRVPRGWGIEEGLDRSFILFLGGVLVFGFSTGLVQLYIAGLPLRSCQTIGAPSVQGSAQSLYFRF